MAKTDNLQDYLTDLANAIREKKGTTELINPQDFSTEIRGISGGGNAGRTIYVKLDWNNHNPENQPVVGCLLYGSLARGLLGDTSAIFPITFFEQNTQSITAYSLHLDDIIKMKTTDKEMEATIEEQLTGEGIDLSSFPLITKEQFYDLTTEI